MKALTVWQPWAQLLAMGTKSNETRSWGTKYRGRILIHAAKIDHQYIVGKYPHELFQYFETAGAIYKDFPLGAIIGQANLVECIQMDQDYCDWMKKWNPGEYAFGDYAPGRYAWVMKDAVLFDKQIPASGKQGLWNWEGELPV